jgi:hypothetical protein
VDNSTKPVTLLAGISFSPSFPSKTLKSASSTEVIKLILFNKELDKLFSVKPDKCLTPLSVSHVPRP